MRSKLPLTIASLSVAAVLALTIAARPANAPSRVASGVGPKMESIGPLAIGPSGVLYAADPQAAAIYALDLTAQPASTPGTQDITGLDEKIAAMLGTAAKEISITDLKVDPKTHNSYIAVMRGQGSNAAPALLRVDGAGKIDLLSLDAVKFTSVALPNAPDLSPAGGRSNRSQSITNMAFNNGKLSSPACRMRSSHQSSGESAIRSPRLTAARASRSSMVRTAATRRARRCTHSCRTRRTASPT